MDFKFRNIFHRDIDQVFSYKTNIEVVILDRYVGIIFRIFQMTVIAYFLYINITGKSDAIRKDFSKGITLVGIAGSGLNSEGELFDEMDIIEPEAYSDSVFLATGITITSQKKDTCIDTNFPCSKDTDCKLYIRDKCVNGSCSGYGWCPDKKNSEYTLKYDMGDNLLIWVRSYIQFASFDSSPRFYSNFYSNDPYFKSEIVNVFSINDLLRRSSDIILFNSLKETGGILKVNLIWRCHLMSDCDPEINVRRLDMQPQSEALIGYNSVKYYSNKASERTVHNMTGIRIIFSTEGIGYKVSLENIIFQIANFVSLMLIPKLLADFILIYILKYEDYSGYKYENPLIGKKEEEEESELLMQESKKEADKNKKALSEDEDHEEEKGSHKEHSEDELLKDLDDTP